MTAMVRRAVVWYVDRMLIDAETKVARDPSESDDEWMWGVVGYAMGRMAVQHLVVGVVVGVAIMWVIG